MPTLKKSHTYRVSRYGTLLPLNTKDLIMQSNEGTVPSKGKDPVSIN